MMPGQRQCGAGAGCWEIKYHSLWCLDALLFDQLARHVLYFSTTCSSGTLENPAARPCTAIVDPVQGYLAHKEPPHPRTLHWAYPGPYGGARGGVGSL